MAKKHWIYIKRGLSEDPKHRANMGESVWLYMHIIDRADWETGIAYDWRDSEEAVDMCMPIDTLRRQRQKLSDLRYISCQQKKHGQNIIIHEWRNPREYAGEIKNPRSEGSHPIPPLEFDDDNKGDNNVTLQVRTLPLDSKSKSFTEDILKNASLDWQLAGGLSSEEIAQHNLREEKERQVANLFEQAMGYQPLAWWNDPRLGKLLKFLLTRTPEEIKTFAAWSRREYSNLRPEKIRINPQLAIDCWLLAFPHREELPRHNDADEILNDDESKYVPPPEGML